MYSTTKQNPQLLTSTPSSSTPPPPNPLLLLLLSPGGRAAVKRQVLLPFGPGARACTPVSLFFIHFFFFFQFSIFHIFFLSSKRRSEAAPTPPVSGRLRTWSCRPLSCLRGTQPIFLQGTRGSDRWGYILRTTHTIVRYHSQQSPLTFPSRQWRDGGSHPMYTPGFRRPRLRSTRTIPPDTKY